MHSTLIVAFFSLLVITNTYALADDQAIMLQDGSSFSVDPVTQKAIRLDEPGTPLWDGVHRLNDGSVMIVRDGVVISGGTMQETSTEQAEIVPAAEDEYKISPCIQLSINSCGFNGECKDSTACLTARQLVNLELEEKLRGVTDIGVSTTDQCREALTDHETFAICQTTTPSALQTPCSQLTAHVCGFKDQCADSEACEAARQLQSMELEERKLSRHRGRLSHSSLQCLEGVKNSDYFKPCLPPVTDE